MVFYLVSETLNSALAHEKSGYANAFVILCVWSLASASSLSCSLNRGAFYKRKPLNQWQQLTHIFCIFIFISIFFVFFCERARASAMLWFTFWHRFCALMFLELCAFVLTLWRRHIFQFCTSIGTQLHIRRNTHIEQLHSHTVHRNMKFHQNLFKRKQRGTWFTWFTFNGDKQRKLYNSNEMRFWESRVNRGVREIKVIALKSSRQGEERNFVRLACVWV